MQRYAAIGILQFYWICFVSISYLGLMQLNLSSVAIYWTIWVALECLLIAYYYKKSIHELPYYQ